MSEVAASKEAGKVDAPEEVEELKVNRQEFLNIAWLASLGFLTIGLSGVTLIFSWPRFREGEFGGLTLPLPVANLPEIGSAPENNPKIKLWLSNTNEGVMALYKVCPHLGCLFAWNDAEFKFICPCHGSQYENDGDYISGPAPRSLDRFAIRILDENGDTLAETPEDGGPVPLPDNPNAVLVIDTGKRILGETHE